MNKIRLMELAGLIKENKFSHLERGTTKKGKPIVFFGSTRDFTKAIMQYLPSSAIIKLKSASFSGLGYGSSYACTITLDGKQLPSMGNPEDYVSFQPLLDGIKKFRNDLGGENTAIGIGDADEYRIITGL